MKIEKLHVPLVFYKTEYVSFGENKFNYNSNKPAILMLITPFKFDGLVMHSLSSNKAHLNNGHNIYTIVLKDSDAEKKLVEQKISYYRFTKSKIFKPFNQPGISKIIQTIVKKHNIKIIHCNVHKEINMLKKIKDTDVKIILTRHSPNAPALKYLKKFNMILCVNNFCINKINKKFENKKIKPPIIKHISPFFNEQESLNFVPDEKTDKQSFFKKEFGLDILPHPIITMTARLLRYKNHELMLKAIHKLVYEKNTQVNLVLCGDGKRKDFLKTLAKQLKIDKYVHFLGFTYKRIEVMYHSDINALTTRDEAFGIALMEAALLRKVLIGPTKTGVINTIKHEKTGLLFENNNLDDLVEKLEILIKNSNTRKKFGQNAYKHVKNNFISNIVMQKIENFYSKI